MDTKNGCLTYEEILFLVSCQAREELKVASLRANPIGQYSSAVVYCRIRQVLRLERKLQHGEDIQYRLVSEVLLGDIYKTIFVVYSDEPTCLRKL